MCFEQDEGNNRVKVVRDGFKGVAGPGSHWLWSEVQLLFEK